MTNFVDILEEQIDEERKTRPKTPISESDSKMIRKKELIPLKADMEIQLDEIPAEPVKVHPPAAPPSGNRSPKRGEEPKGGALWGTPEQQQEMQKSMEKAQTPDPPKGKCLMDLIMEPEPKRPKKPTLFTYFDHLMANGEV